MGTLQWTKCLIQNVKIPLFLDNIENNNPFLAVNLKFHNSTPSYVLFLANTWLRISWLSYIYMAKLARCARNRKNQNNTPNWFHHRKSVWISRRDNLGPPENQNHFKVSTFSTSSTPWHFQHLSSASLGFL